MRLIRRESTGRAINNFSRIASPSEAIGINCQHQHPLHDGVNAGVYTTAMTTAQKFST
ncbi:hypothetical protein JXJ21_11550 [candidate division KSB1 bacterium]|nr:hypothetical protein [candidate division KSB1 bacterium]